MTGEEGHLVIREEGGGHSQKDNWARGSTPKWNCSLLDQRLTKVYVNTHVHVLYMFMGLCQATVMKWKTHMFFI